MKKLIGIAGKARSGKDTIAKHLWSRHGFLRIALADPLKSAAQAMFALSNEQTWDDNLKEIEIPHWGMSPRQMFQRLGNDAVKPVFGEDLWLKRWLITYAGFYNSDDVVVPDIRFDHEAAMIRGREGIIIHLYRENAQQVSPHVSENGVTYREGDIVLGNNSTIDDLIDLVDAVVDGMEMRK